MRMRMRSTLSLSYKFFEVFEVDFPLTTRLEAIIGHFLMKSLVEPPIKCLLKKDRF